MKVHAFERGEKEKDKKINQYKVYHGDAYAYLE